MKTSFVTLLLLIFGVHCYSQTLPLARSVNWKLAGYNSEHSEPFYSVNFLNNGGVADGITPNDLALATLINSIMNDSSEIYFPTGVYYFEQPIVLNKKLTLRGASADSAVLLFNLINEDHLIKIAGSITTIESVILNDIYKDSLQVDVLNPGLFATGDYIKITENDSSLITSSWALRSTGQVNRIDSITGNTVYLISPLRRNFYFNKNVKMTKILPAEERVIENLMIFRQDTTVQQTSNIFFNYAINCKVKCIESVNCNYAHIAVDNSSNIEISGSYFHDAFSYGDGGKGYGVMLEFGTGECLIKENIFNHLRHSMILQAGANGNVFGYNYSINPFWTGTTFPSNSSGDIVLHGNYPYCNLFEGNVSQNIVIDDSHGQNGLHNTFFRNRAELYGLYMNNSVPTNNQNFIGNEIPNTALFMGNYVLSGTGHFQFGNNIKGTILPGGTSLLPESSLYLDTIPPYYQQTSSWPPIGIPNLLSTYQNEIQIRYNSGKLTKCADSISVINVNAIISINDIKIVPNPTSTTINIVYIQESQNPILSIDVFSFSGEKVLSNTKRAGISLEKLPGGFYFIKIRLADNQIVVRKIIKVN